MSFDPVHEVFGGLAECLIDMGCGGDDPFEGVIDWARWYTETRQKAWEWANDTVERLNDFQWSSELHRELVQAAASAALSSPATGKFGQYMAETTLLLMEERLRHEVEQVYRRSPLYYVCP